MDQVFELGTLGAYLFLLLWIGIRSARQVRTSADYTLAGRDVPWIVLIATIGATMIGGGASMGMVSRVYEVGIAAAFVTCAWHLQLIFVGLWVAPRLRRLNLVTVGDYFELKYGRLARELAVVSCLVYTIGILSAQMVAMGTVTNAILGVSYETALLIGASITIFYSTVGGIRAVVKTDVLQFTILVVGIGAAAAILVERNGGFAAMAGGAMSGQFVMTSQWSGVRITSLFFAFMLGELFVPAFTVRCFIAKDAAQSRLGMAGAGILLILFLPIATFVLGTSAQIDPQVRQAVEAERQEIVQHAEALGLAVSAEEARSQATQMAFPALVRTTFHPIFAGVMIAAIIAAVMSSADSILSCLATIVMKDYYQQHIRHDASDRQLLRVARWTTLVAGSCAAVSALFFSNITDTLEFVYDLWAPSMVLPFLIGVFAYKKDRVYAVVASMLSGWAATLIWRFALGSPGDLGPALFGTLVAFLTFGAAVPLTRHWRLGLLFKPSEQTTEETA